MTRVQICGITSLADALMCEEEGADAIGLVLAADRAREIPIGLAKEIREQLGPLVHVTGIFTSSDIERVCDDARSADVDMVQVYNLGIDAVETIHDHGFKCTSVMLVPQDDSLSGCPIPNLTEMSKVSDIISFEPSRHGVYGGRGFCIDISMLRKHVLPFCNGRFALAGGLAPDTLSDALATRPYAIHVSSGVEEEVGKKDRMLVRRFLSQCKGGTRR